MTQRLLAPWPPPPPPPPREYSAHAEAANAPRPDLAPAAVSAESLDHIDLGDGIYYPNHLSLLGSAYSLAIARYPVLLPVPFPPHVPRSKRSKVTLKKKW